MVLYDHETKLAKTHRSQGLNAFEEMLRVECGK